MSETLYIWEKKVKGSVPAEVSSLFAALTGGLEKLERNFSPSGVRRREESDSALKQVDALEEMAISLAVAAIRTQTETMRARIVKLERLVAFEETDSSIVLSIYTGDFGGLVWLRWADGGVETGLEVSRRNDGGFVGERVVVATDESFSAAYDWAMDNKETLLERLAELIAAAKVVEGVAE